MLPSFSPLVNRRFLPTDQSQWFRMRESGKLGKEKPRPRISMKEENPWRSLFWYVVLTASVVATIHSRNTSLQDIANTRVDEPKAGRIQEPQIENLNRMYESKESIDKEIGPEDFEKSIHETYERLPQLENPSKNILNGGWNLTTDVYDFAANHESAHIISWDNPRIVLFRSFLTPEEVKHLIDVAKENLERSHVVSPNGDKDDEVNDARTSFGAWPKRDKTLAAVYNRIHRLVGIPEPFGEDSYILNYKKNQKYDAHFDNCMDDLNARGRTADKACQSFLSRAGGPKCGPGHGGPSCGDRIATFIMFLKSPIAGGHTVFPNAQITKDRLQKANKMDVIEQKDDWYCEHDEVLSVSASPGDGLLFWDYKPSNGTGMGSYEDGTADPSGNPVFGALHSGCPVQSGEKWIATRWIRSAKFV